MEPPQKPDSQSVPGVPPVKMRFLAPFTPALLYLAMWNSVYVGGRIAVGQVSTEVLVPLT